MPPPMKSMRCKVTIQEVHLHGATETIIARPVCKPGGYPPDGADEDNTFARWSPSGEFRLCIANPDLFDTYKPGQVFYVDWTPIEPTA